MEDGTSLRVAVCGGVDSGKSTLIGVLTHNVLDDGNGYARSLITKLKHELESRHTSNISYNYIRYPNKEVTLIDLAGHEVYFKTTIFGISAHMLDYAIVTVGANLSLNKMTRQHILLLMWLQIPFIIVITKVDICPEEVYIENRKNFRRFLNNITNGSKKITLIKNERYDQFFGECSDPEYFNSNIPILTTSATKNFNIDKIHDMFKLLTPRHGGIDSMILPQKGHILAYIECVYNVKNVGIVITGYLSKSCEPMTLGSTFYIGPFGHTNPYFVPVTIRSMHDNWRNGVKVINPGHSFCSNIRFPQEKITKQRFKKGMIITSDPSTIDKVSMRFMAKIKIIDMKTTVNIGYSPVVHYRTVRQAAKIVQVLEVENDREEHSLKPDIDKECKTTVIFEFIARPEYIEEGVTLFFRDGNTKGVGRILNKV